MEYLVITFAASIIASYLHGFVLVLIVLSACFKVEIRKQLLTG